jgi:metal-responsive CopG/Arc/MetJ family transcriptional regulator
MAKKQQRGAVTKGESTLVAVWLPIEVLKLLDHRVRAADTDRSKEIRKALRNHLGKIA